MASRRCPGLANGTPPCPASAIVTVRPGSKQAARCPRCAKAHEARRRQRRPYDHAERLEHQAIIAAWVALHGWTCPGCGPSDGKPHPSTDLTVDHAEMPVALGGRRVAQRKRVVCRPGNSAAGANVRRRRPAGG
jgi:hypothetical protein